MTLESAPTSPHEAPPPIEAPDTVLLHSGMNVPTVFGTFASGAVFPVAAGLALFGWRAMIALLAVVLSAMAAAAIWRRIGLRGGQIRVVHTLWLSVVLGMMLPAHIAVAPKPGEMPIWPILPAAGTTLVILNWLLGGMGLGRIHPVLVTYLLMVALFGSHLNPTTVLQRHALFNGDVLDAGEATMAESKDPWISRPQVGGQAALRVTPATEVLQKYTRATEESWLSMDALVRDRLPPIQDLILAGQPGGIGASSVLAIVMGGLFLLYRGLIDWRIPFVIVVGMMAALYILPVPVVIADTAEWSWAAISSSRVSWATGMTFVHYELLAGPTLFMAVFLATDPSVRPMAKWSRAGYALLIGGLAAVFQRYLDVRAGAYLALLVGSLATPFLDKALRPKPIV
jgi:Na+-translocating ferredoxin:NAD+ oxidoreductase RnfD subunit